MSTLLEKKAYSDILVYKNKLISRFVIYDNNGEIFSFRGCELKANLIKFDFDILQLDMVDYNRKDSYFVIDPFVICWHCLYIHIDLIKFKKIEDMIEKTKYQIDKYKIFEISLNASESGIANLHNDSFIIKYLDHSKPTKLHKGLTEIYNKVTTNNYDIDLSFAEFCEIYELIQTIKE